MEISKVEIRQQLLDLKIGQFVKIAMREGSFIGGIFIKKSECLSPDGIKYWFNVRINDTTALDISEDSVIYVEVVNFDSDEIIYDFGQRTGIKTFDDDHRRIDANKVLRDIISCDTWDDFTKEEQEQVVRSLCIPYSDVVELIGVVRSLEKECQECHKEICDLVDKHIDIHQKIIDWKKYYDEMANYVPGCKVAFDVVYKLLGLEDLLMSI